MKREAAFAVLAILIVVVTTAGCTGVSGTSTSTPEGTWATYTKAFNRGDGDTVYSLLSSAAKSENDKDYVHNVVYALNSNWVKYDSYSIIRKGVQEDRAGLEMEVTISVKGYQKTSTDMILFVKEGGSWKLQEFYIPHN